MLTTVQKIVNMSRGCQRHKMQRKTYELRIDSKKCTSLTIEPKFSFIHNLTGGSFPFAWVRALGDGRILALHFSSEDRKYLFCAGAEIEAIAHSSLCCRVVSKSPVYNCGIVIIEEWLQKTETYAKSKIRKYKANLSRFLPRKNLAHCWIQSKYRFLTRTFFSW